MVMRTADQALMKEMNRSVVLNQIRFHSPISRAQISVQTGLNKATVSALVDGLLRDGLALELGQEAGQSRVGRRPIPLCLNTRAGHAVGVELGVEYVRLIVTDLAANILQTTELALPGGANAAEIVETMISAIREIISSWTVSKYGVIGIGVGVPGLVDFERGVVLNAPHLHWDNIPLKAIMENRLDMPVFVDNEANAGAFGEKLYGAGVGVANLLYVSAGTGVGTGIVIGNELLRGADGIAGEFGHMSINQNGPACPCGNCGCWEMYASETALITKYEELTNCHASFEQIRAAFHDANAAAVQSFQSIGKSLGVGVVNLMNGLNPSMVIVGNRIAEGGKSVLDGIQQSIASRSFTAPYAHVSVQSSAFGRDACAIGGAALVLQDFFAIDR